MNFGHFLAAIFFGRLLRFSLVSLIVIRYGPAILGFVGGMVHRHLRLAIAVIAAALLIGWWFGGCVSVAHGGEPSGPPSKGAREDTWPRQEFRGGGIARLRTRRMLQAFSRRRAAGVHSFLDYTQVGTQQNKAAQWRAARDRGIGVAQVLKLHR